MRCESPAAITSGRRTRLVSVTLGPGTEQPCGGIPAKNIHVTASLTTHVKQPNKKYQYLYQSFQSKSRPAHWFPMKVKPSVPCPSSVTEESTGSRSAQDRPQPNVSSIEKLQKIYVWKTGKKHHEQRYKPFQLLRSKVKEGVSKRPGKTMQRNHRQGRTSSRKRSTPTA